jgi:D-3-phosphoglycerate dehydrogenase
MKTILVTTSTFGKNDPDVLNPLAEKGYEYFLNPYGRKLTEEEVIELINKHRPIGMIAGVEPLNRKVMESASGLKSISRLGIGLDNVDLVAAEDMGIAVSNTPDGPTIPVAELTLGMIISLLRQIHISDISIRQGEWRRPYGNLLYGKTVGIIGCGRIGSYLAKLLQSFGCNVLGCDPVCMEEECFALVGLDEILQRADIISLHIPYSKANHHFINANRLKQMKEGAYLINTARGGLVDEQALFQSLVSGKLAGAALDGFEQEPYLGKLKDLDNVLMTAHIGSYAKEARIMMEKEAVSNLITTLEATVNVK